MDQQAKNRFVLVQDDELSKYPLHPIATLLDSKEKM